MDIQVDIEVKDQEVKDILVAILSDKNFIGFEESAETLTGFVKEEDFNEEELKELLAEYKLASTHSTIEKKNWNEVWESSFSPVIVEDFCSIRADFHPAPEGVQFDIIITPKMSFGTGHHATTYLMLQQMREIDFKGKTVADFGTGTGILSIMSEKLGATSIWAIDNDEWSIENAKENFERNHCSLIRLEQKNEFSTNETFDIILANINRNVILQNLPALVKGLINDGILLLSGLLKTDENEVVKQAEAHYITAKKIVEKDGWISIWLGR